MSETETTTKQMPPARKFEARTIRVTEWVASLSKRNQRFEHAELTAVLDSAAASMKKALELIKALPDDCGLKAKSIGSKAFDVGVKVDIKDRFRESYDDLLEPKDLVNLEVVKVAKGKVAVDTASGIRMFFPKSHLVPSATDDDDSGDDDSE